MSTTQSTEQNKNAAAFMQVFSFKNINEWSKKYGRTYI